MRDCTLPGKAERLSVVGNTSFFLIQMMLLKKTTLHKIYSEIEQSNPDILRFGLICKEQNGMDDHAARDLKHGRMQIHLNLAKKNF